jgi:hypothetical protein
MQTMQIPRFSPMDDDNSERNETDSAQFEAGYAARLNNVPMAYSSTKSWKAGWCDADASITAVGR